MITIVIPSWNGKELLSKHLPSVIKAGKNRKNRIKEILIVDDASSDGSAEYLEEKYGKELRIVRQKENRGFASSVNLGVRMAKSELVCLLNNDVSVSVNFLEKISSHFGDEKVFGVSLHERGYGPAAGCFSNGYFEHTGLLAQSAACESLWASGGSGVFRRSVWMKLKGFDEELYAPFYWEDVDIGYRAWKRGYKILWEPGALVDHEHEATISTDNFRRRKMNYIKERNQLLFMWKNIGSLKMIRKHYWGVLRRVMKGPGYMVVVFLALKKIGVVRRKRIIEQRDQKVSDEAVLARFI